jgi:hypothetical protein
MWVAYPGPPCTPLECRTCNHKQTKKDRRLAVEGGSMHENVVFGSFTSLIEALAVPKRDSSVAHSKY